MILRRLGCSTNEPVTLEDIHNHLRISSTDDDPYLKALITVAREQAENHCKRAFIASTFELILDNFPSNDTAAIMLPRSPISTAAAAVSITFTKDTTLYDSTSVNATVYAIESDPGRIYPCKDNEWPSCVAEVPSAVTVTYQCGTVAVPEPVKAWIKIRVASMYEQREAFVDTRGALQEVPRTFIDGLLDPYVTPEVY